MKIILPAFLILSCGVTVFAQQQYPDSLSVLDEVVISANKIPEERSQIAQQVQVISAVQIKNLNAQTAADLLSNSGKVAVQKSQQGGGSPQLRGFEASRIVLVVDGVRMNNLIYRAGHLQNIITLDNNMLERAEILFGPSSTVYGSDALGGVIHFFTRDPKLGEGNNKTFFGNTYFRYGTVNREQTGHFDFNIGGKKFASFTSFTYSDFDDLKMGKKKNPALDEEFGLRRYYVERAADNQSDVLVENDKPYVQKFSGYQQYDFLQKFLFKPSARISHLLNIQYSTSSDIPRYDRLTDTEGSGLRNAEWYYGPQDRFMIAYQFIANDLGSIADLLRATVSYQGIEESRHDRRFNRVNRRNQIENVDVWGLTIDLQKSIGGNNIRYGLDAQFNNLKSTAYNQDIITGMRSPVSTRYPDGKNTMNYFALYATHTRNLGQRFILNDGLRIGFSGLKSTFEDKTFFPFPFDEVNQKNTYASGNVGLIYKPTQQWNLSFMTSTGYRVPNVDDLGKVFDTSAGEALIVPNPDIKPETTLNFDLAITRFFGDKVRWENVGYYTSFFDAIVLDDFSFNGQSTIAYDGAQTPVMANQNKRRAFLYGYTSAVHADLHKNFSVEASFNYTYGRVKTDTANAPLDHIPPSFGRASVQYERQKFRAEAFVNFSGWKHIDDYLLNAEDNEQYAPAKGMPSWYIVNLRASYTFNKSLVLQAGVDNLLDLQYRTFGSGINAPGRNIFGTLRLSF